MKNVFSHRLDTKFIQLKHRGKLKEKDNLKADSEKYVYAGEPLDLSVWK